MADSSKSRGDGKPTRAASPTPESDAEEPNPETLDHDADNDADAADQATEADESGDDLDGSADDAGDAEQADEADDESAEAELAKPKPVKRNQTVAPVKKAKPTPKQSDAKKGERKSTTPVQFVKQAVGELKKVVWPTPHTTWQYFLVVLVFVLFIMAFVAGLDALFGWLLLLWLA
ncbi:preprotein translocase subunit SecE [Propionimicrobium sp. PCR01-08-3]|uniref:preprotein translocase subunit SecE n=1 Tax=Propionimicrobium sp. PCR01-08-3 TaxID=3052086 RepID=UPI00255CFE74|nr:preprotein translocase subunit SecE [Propionimicrobium sp. PCR01-08-3]WIY83159.1 preprotein translocase subunit SecE [Propionimicrobium sp. PCR01-08-3]